MSEDRLQSQLSDDIERLDSRDPIQRLTAVRKVRAYIATLEEAAVAQARSADVRHSWDEIARVMGTTRWSVLRRFGPHGTHPAGEVPVVEGEAPASPAVTEGALRGPDSLPAELLQKVILLVGELVSSSLRAGRSLSGDPVAIRLQVLPRSIRIEVVEPAGHPRVTSASIAEGPVPSTDQPAAAPMWIELDLPLESLLSEVNAARGSPVLPQGGS